MRIKFLIYCFSFCLAANCLPKNDKVVHDDFEKLNSSFWYYNEKAWGFYSKDLDSMSFYNEVSKVHIDDELMQRNFELLQAVKYTYNQEYRKALLHLDTCINTFVTHQHAESLLKAYGLYAQVNNYLGKFEDSEVYTRLALEVAHQTRDSSNILKYTINLGSALLQNEKFDEGISIFRDAEKRLNQAHVLERGVVWYNLSKIYLYQGVFDLALGLSEKAIYWFERNELNPYLFGAYLNHCEILLEQGEWDLFLLCADKAASFVVYDFERSDLSFIKAEFSLKNDKFLEAKEYIKESIAIDSVSNPSKLGEDYLILAQISFKMHAYPEAFICVKKAIESFDNTNELININQAYHLFFKLLFLQEDNDDADTYFDEYLNNLKTLQDQQKNNILLKLEKEFRTKEKELIISNQEKLIASEGNKKRLLFFLLVAITFLLVTVLLFMRLDAKRKSLNEKNKGYMLNHKINALELSVLNQQL
ncbi:MAG: hypothetical protein LAT76_08220, partial [Schleiferiaceae bacterium]|nr:hypothetical protein [Schleiferiaceae bacterium]